MACAQREIFLDLLLVPSVTSHLEEEALTLIFMGKENPRHFEMSSEFCVLQEAGSWTRLCLGAFSLGNAQ